MCITGIRSLWDQSSKQYRSWLQTRTSSFPSVHNVLRTCPSKQMDLLLPRVRAMEKVGGECYSWCPKFKIIYLESVSFRLWDSFSTLRIAQATDLKLLKTVEYFWAVEQRLNHLVVRLYFMGRQRNGWGSFNLLPSTNFSCEEKPYCPPQMRKTKNYIYIYIYSIYKHAHDKVQSNL